MANKFKSWFIRTGGIKTHFIEAGEGDPLILIHGGGPGASGEHNWGNNIESLARHFHVFALDLIGYGLTDKPAIEYSYQAKIDQLRAAQIQSGEARDGCASLAGGIRIVE